MHLKGAWAIHRLCEVAHIPIDPTDIPQIRLGLFGESAARRSAAQYESAKRGRPGGKRRREDDADGDEDDDDDEEETLGAELISREEAGTSAAPEAGHVRFRPRIPAVAAPVTLQSLYDLLMEERAT